MIWQTWSTRKTAADAVFEQESRDQREWLIEESAMCEKSASCHRLVAACTPSLTACIAQKATTASFGERDERLIHPHSCPRRVRRVYARA